MYFFFFFQAEDGIRDLTVTGVQTCALPIFGREERDETGSDEGMVVGGEDPDGRRAGHPDDDIAFSQDPHTPKEVVWWPCWSCRNVELTASGGAPWARSIGAA